MSSPAVKADMSVTDTGDKIGQNLHQTSAIAHRLEVMQTATDGVTKGLATVAKIIKSQAGQEIEDNVKEALNEARQEAKPKAPRKRAMKKIVGEQNDSLNEAGGQHQAKKSKVAASKSKKQEMAGETSGEGVGNAEDDIDLAAPKDTIDIGGVSEDQKPTSGNEDVAVTTQTPQKRESIAEPGGDDESTPAKKKRGRAAAAKIPTTREETSPEDCLLIEMKKNGSSWADITAAYAKMAGTPLSTSTLRHRHTKIVASLTEWKDGDIERMLFVKEKLDKETEKMIMEYKKKAEHEIWAKVATAIAEIGGDNYSSGAVEKAFIKEKNDSFPHKANMHAIVSKYMSGDDVEDGLAEGNEIDGKAGSRELQMVV